MFTVHCSEQLRHTHTPTRTHQGPSNPPRPLERLRPFHPLYPYGPDPLLVQAVRCSLLWPPVAFGGLQWRSVAARATHFSGRSQVRSRRFQRRSQVLPRPRHPAKMDRRDLHASYTCSRDLRSTRGTGRPTREVPNGCQPVGAQCTARHGTRADTGADTDGGGPARRDLRAPHTSSRDPR